MGKISRRKNRKKYIANTAPPAVADNNPLNNEVNKNRNKARYVLISCLCLAIIYLAWQIINWLQEPAKVLVKGSVEKSHSLKTSFSTGPENGTSLGCGCIKPIAANYRGIGIISNELYISNGNDHGGFVFFATHPGPTSIIPELSFEGTIFQIAIDSYREKMNDQKLHTPEIWGQNNPFIDFSPDKLLDPTFKNSRIVSTFKFRDAYSLHFEDVRNIHIDQFGPIPFIAWNPVAGGQVQINFDQGQREISIIESIGNRTQNIKENGDKTVTVGNEIIHPVADFAGIPLIIWSDKFSSIFLDGRPVPKKENLHKPTFTVILLKAAFSIRMVALSSASTYPWESATIEFDENTSFKFNEIKNGSVERALNKYGTNAKDLSDELSDFLGEKIVDSDIKKITLGTLIKPDVSFYYTKIPNIADNETLKKLSKVGFGAWVNPMPWGFHERESKLPLQHRIIPVIQAITNREKTEYTIKSYLNNTIKESKLHAQYLVKNHTSLGTSLYYGQKDIFNYGYPSIGESWITLHGFDSWIELDGSKGQIQVASELKQLVGGNHLKLNNIVDILEFSHDGQIQLNTNADRFEIDNRYFSNFDKYKTPLTIIAAIAAFLGLKQISDYFKLIKYVSNLGKYVFNKLKNKSRKAIN